VAPAKPEIQKLAAGRKGALRLVLIGGYDDRFYQFMRNQNDYAVDLIADSGHAVAAARAGRLAFDLAITGLRIKPADGMEVLKVLREADPDAPVIISTHETSPRVVVQAMQAGAFDYVIEPYEDYGPVKDAMDRAAARRRTLLAARDLSGQLHRPVDFPEVVGASRAVTELRRNIRKAASADGAVLLTGESGTGKGLVAAAIHRASARSGGPFVTVNCGAIPEQLVESELFGHVRGAFTGAVADREGRVGAADGGTLFLDEIAELSPGTQVKLLRFLEDRSYEAVGDSRPRSAEVRIISATNSNLAARINGGLFREDLFYRVNVLCIHVVPLRERREDVPLLAQHFLEQIAAESGKPVRALSAEALSALAAHDWPGNIRELRNVMERAVIWSSGETVTVRDLPASLGGGSSTGAAPVAATEQGLGQRLRSFERQAILDALEATDWVRAKAAQRLQIPRTTLIRRMKELQITR
jgi:DNA-binding NtrC family response regulator